MAETLTTKEVTDAVVAMLRRSAKPPMVFREVAIDGRFANRGRLDVVAYSVGKGYTAHYLRGFEVKATKGDLGRDLETGKWRQYLDRLDVFSFVFPAGLAKVDDIPKPAGVVTVNERGEAKVARKPIRLEREDVQPDLLARLLWRAHDRMREVENSRSECERCDKRERAERLQQELDDRFLYYELGDAVRKRLTELEHRERRADAREEQLKTLEDSVDGVGPALMNLGKLLRLAESAVGGETHRATSADQVEKDRERLRDAASAAKLVAR